MGKGKGEQVPPPPWKCSVLCISSYSKTLNRPIIYALFSQFLSASGGFDTNNKRVPVVSLLFVFEGAVYKFSYLWSVCTNVQHIQYQVVRLS